MLRLLILAAGPAGAQPAPPLEMDLSAAWDGWVRAGAVTEVAVRLLAPESVELRLSLTADGLQVTQDVTLEANRSAVVRLPARSRDGTVAVEATAPGQGPLRRMLSLKALRTPVIAAVLAEPPPLTSAGANRARWLFPAADSLPHWTDAFDTVDALILDAASLQQLSTPQRAALEAYLARCGRVVISSAPAAPERLRPAAGCGGRFLRGAADLRAARAQAAALVAHAVVPLPESPTLRRLAPPGLAVPASLIALSAAYCLALLGLARTRARPLWLVAVPLATSALVIVAGHQAPPDTRLVAWAEMHNGDATARFAALLEVRGRGRGVHRLALPRAVGVPDASDLGGPPVLTGAGQLTIATGLMSADELVLRGSFAPPPGLELALKAGAPVVVNHGDEVSKPAVLSWQGRRYDVPALAAGRRWAPRADGARLWSGSALDATLRARSQGDAATLLQRLPVPGLDSPQASWLLILVPAGERA